MSPSAAALLLAVAVARRRSALTLGRARAQYLDYLNMRANVLSRAFGVPAAADDRGARWREDDAAAAGEDGGGDGDGDPSLGEELR